MKWLVDNWSLIVTVLAVIVYFLLNGVQSVKNYLLIAVTLAEQDLGSGTGRLKLSKVYSEFVSAYPIFSKILPFPVFSAIVDSVLVEMRKLLESNKNVQDYVGGK